MKYLSFIAVFFYLSLLFPTAAYSASSSWVDLQQANKNFSATLVAANSHSTVDSTETSNDDEKGTVSWTSFEFPAAQPGIDQQQQYHSSSSQGFYSARAPPVYLC